MLVKRIQLGLIHVAVAMTLVPINSTLNRVMIKELAISATLVALLASLPYLFSPIQMAIGSFSDRHPLWGLRRTPYIALGLVLCVIGVALSPQVAFMISTNWWAGVLLGIFSFGAWGMGFNFATVSYLSLASEISGEKERGRTISVMWFMMIVAIIATAFSLSHMIDPYTPIAMKRAFLVVAFTALVLGLLGLLGLESRSSRHTPVQSENQSWKVLYRAVLANRQATHFFWYLVVLLAALLGQDILLEPFAGEAFGMTVRETTRITSLWGSCFLVTLALTGILEARVGKRSAARWGGYGALFGFILIVLSGIVVNSTLFYVGVIFLGGGSGLSTVSNLSLMLDMTTASNVGLFMGAWGMANAFSRLIGTLLGGMLRDLVSQIWQNLLVGYLAVFVIEAGLIFISLKMLRSIDVVSFQQGAKKLSIVERSATALDM